MSKAIEEEDEPEEPMQAASEVEILGAEDGLRLDRALAQHFTHFSRTRLKALIEAGQVSLTREGDASGGSAPAMQASVGALVQRDPAARVRTGQNFVVIFGEAEAAAPLPQAIALDIRFEDPHLLVIDKPAGMVVHPAPGNPDGTLVNALLAHCGDSLSGIGGVRRPGIVHRLDKDTSGLMVVAKTEPAHHALSRDFAARRIGREYAAFVWGAPTPRAGEIVGNIGRSPVNRKKMAVVPDPRGKPALTRYRVEAVFGAGDGRGGAAALIACRLATGRTHQIRVHLSAKGHALIGDPLYGTRGGRALARMTTEGATISAFSRQALHARLLSFVHPASGKELAFASELPPDLLALKADLEML